MFRHSILNRLSGLFLLAATWPAVATAQEPGQREPQVPELMLAFERPGEVDTGFFDDFRDEILYANGLEEWYREATGLLGLSAETSLDRLRIVARSGESGGGLVGVATGPAVPAIRERLARTGSLAAQRHGSGIVYLGPRGEKSGREHAFAALGDERLLFGEPAAVRRVAEDAGPLQGISEAPDFEPGVKAAAWGVISPRWLKLEELASAPGASDLPELSMTKSMAGIREMVFRARIDSEIHLRIETRAGTENQASVLLDELRAFLGGVQSSASGPEPVRAVIDQARASRDGVDISVEFRISPAAMAQIRRNPVSESLFSWRFGSDARERREHLREIFDLLALREGTRVADIGAGEGFHAVRMARTVGPTGRVFAVEIDSQLVSRLRRRAQDAGLPQIEAVLGTPENPGLPEEGLDCALIVNAYHEMTQHEQMLVYIREALKPGGRLVLVEPFDPSRRSEPRASQVEDHVIAPELVEDELRRAGFEVVIVNEDFLIRPQAARKDFLIVATR